MRPPEATGSPSPARTSERSLLSRINALNAVMQEHASGGSPATGANALPQSPPLADQRALMPLSRTSFDPSVARGAAGEEVMRMSFETPAETAARHSLKATSPSSSTQPLMDESLFQEHDRSFPVPKYLDHSVWRSRILTWPLPSYGRPSPASRVPLAASGAAYPALLNPPSVSPARTSPERTPPKQQKSQLASSLTAPSVHGSDDWSIPLPTCWDADDRCSLVEVTGDGLEVSFCGSGKNGDRDAAAVRANRHMPSFTGVYYYEVEIVSKGQSGYIAIGFSGLNVSLSRLPGWEANSWGYHGDDGHSFASQGTGRAYGPTFSTGDVVGCGIDFTQQRAFFTKNGAFLGHVFDSLEGQLYPSVGMRTPGEVVRANFGQTTFRFDIESFVVSRKLTLLKEIEATPISERYLVRPSASDPQVPPEPIVPEADRSPNGALPVNMALDDTVASLVSAYLTFHGFVDTAQAFEAQRSADRRRYAELSPPTKANGVHQNGDAEMSDAVSTVSTVMGRRQQICRAVLTGRPDQALELLDAHYAHEASASSGPLSDIVFQLRCQQFIELILSTSPSSPVHVKGKARDTSPSMGALDEALEYGRDLQARYGADERPFVKEGLRRTFALWAYDDPKNATEDEVRWLSGQVARDKLADDLNAAILDAQGQSARPVLETVFKQAVVSVAELGQRGHGGASLVSVADEIFRN